MGEEIIDFRNITYSKAIEIVSPDVVLEERKKYNRDKIKNMDKKELEDTYNNLGIT